MAKGETNRSRATQARLNGAKFFTPVRPCVHGCTTLYYASGDCGNCVGCAIKRAAAQNLDPDDRKRKTELERERRAKKGKA